MGAGKTAHTSSTTGPDQHPLLFDHQRDAGLLRVEPADHPGVALSERGYDERAAQYNAAGHYTLVRAWGPTWADVARRVGLEPGQRAGTKKGTNTKAQKEATEARAIAETEEALARDAELREYWSGGRGLPVLDTPRQLADGRVAWMVR